MKRIYLFTKKLVFYSSILSTLGSSSAQSKKIGRFSKQLLLSLFFLMMVQGTAWGQIAQRGSATFNTSTTTTLAITKPAGVVAGDVMIVNITKTGNTTTNASLTGWTLISGTRQGTGAPRYSTVLYRKVDGTEGTSFTFALGTGTSSSVGSIIAFSGVDASVFDVTPGSFNTYTNNGNTITATGITTITNSAAIVFLAGAGGTNTDIYDSWSGTTPIFTEIMDFRNSIINNSVGAAWGILATAGATGNKTANLSGNYYWAGMLIALKPKQSPTLITTPTSLDFGYTASGGTSSNQTFTLSGSYLTPPSGNITITAPSGFEVSATAGFGFSSSITKAYSASTLANTTIYVRFKPTGSPANFTGNITVSGGGATTKNVALTGTSILVYCTPSATTQWADGITGVVFNTISNLNTGKTIGYTDYTTTQSTSVEKGSSYNLNVFVNTDGDYTNYQKVWIDWNQDGLFNTTAGSGSGMGEEYSLGTANNVSNGISSLCPLSVRTPTGAALGNTRMRVSSAYNNYTTSCATNVDGEFEDYTVNVLPPNYIWVGSLSSTDWDIATNWLPAGVPPSGSNVVFDIAAKNDLFIPVSSSKIIGNLTNASAKNLIIPANASLTISGVITGSSSLADVSKIQIKAAQDATTPHGTLIFSQSSGVYGSVEFYSKSSWDLGQAVGSRYNWQFFGIPIKTAKASPTFDGAYVRKKLESGTTTANHWLQLNNNSVLEPFVGYEICQNNPATYLIEGELVNSDFSSGSLAKTTGALYPGQHLFTNPYTAAIDIRQLVFGSDMEATVFLYNTGTFNQWDSNLIKTGALPGQYIAVPQANAGSGGLPVQVPSMGTMLVHVLSASANAYLSFSYNSVVMRNDLPMRSKSRVQQEDKPKMWTTIEVEGEKSGDKLWLFYGDNYTSGFDNGYDGRKIPGSTMNCQIYTLGNDGDYQINSISDVDNTIIAFQAGVDSVFRLTFNHENLQNRYTNLFLYDTVENKTVDVTDSGSTYSFRASSTPQAVKRFKLFSKNYGDDNSDSSKITYFIDNNTIILKSFSSESGSVQLYDISGRVISNSIIAPFGSDLIPVKSQQIYLLKIIIEGEFTVKKVIVR